MPMLAPHSADAVVAAVPGRSIHRLTIDATLQKSLEELARERARALGPQISVAILAVDHETGEVHARVASSDYFDVSRAGQVDMTQALRSPGSALKPFIYGLGFEDGIIHPETLIDDRPIRYGSYAPENFDLSFQGTVTVRKALAAFAERPGGGGARPGRREPLHRAIEPGRRRAGAAERRGAGTRHGARRRRRHAQRSRDALCRHRAARQHGAAARARRHPTASRPRHAG